MESTSQQTAVASPQASVMPTSVAPQQVAQYVSSPQLTSPAFSLGPMLGATAAAPSQAPIYQQAGLPQASASNPWQEAFQALSASLNTSNPYQAQAPSSAYLTTPTNQALNQASWGSTANSVAQISSPQASTRAYSEAEMDYWVDNAYNLAASRTQDAYLSQVSDESLEVLEHFGAEAPVLLNQYACAVEDALIEQVRRTQAQSLLLEAAGEERAAMNLMLTDPDILADYVNDFFGPNGPYPTPTKEEQAQHRNEAKRWGMQQEMKQLETRGNVPKAFQRPIQEMPRRTKQAGQVQNFWHGLGQMMDNDPENAWKYLSQANNGVFQQKMLVQDL